MSRAKRKGRRKRKPNGGSFRPGFDPRRHRFTTEERRRGYASCLSGRGRCADVHICAWVWRKVRSYYRARKSQDDSGDGTGNEAEVPF